MVHRALLRHLGALASPPPEAGGDGRGRRSHASDAERAAELLERRGDDVCAAFLLDGVLYERGLGASRSPARSSG